MSEPVLTSYAIAYRNSGKTAHIQKNGNAIALCGQGPVIFAGEVKAPDVDFDAVPKCKTCWRIAGPDTTDLWDVPKETTDVQH